MADITASLVKELRDATNVSMMECKRALVEANGNIEQATKLLREKGVAIAAKRASKTTNQGLIASASVDSGKCVSLIEVNCETDFVARNDDFKAFVAELAKKACSTDGNVGDEVKDDIMDKIAAIGENIVARRNTRYKLDGTGILVAYIHLGGKVGVLVEVGCDKQETVTNDAFIELAKDISLHVAACFPMYLVSDEVPKASVDAEREIFAKQVENKPAEMVNKIVDGKLKKYFAEICLMDQAFVKEDKISVRTLLANKSKELNDSITIKRFTRYQLGN